MVRVRRRLLPDDDSSKTTFGASFQHNDEPHVNLIRVYI